MRRRAERRFERTREPLGAGNMNNAKWRHVFELLHGRHVRIKFLDESQARDAASFSCVVEDYWCDSIVGAFAYREIEWLEVSGDDAPALLAELQGSRRLPAIVLSNGFRLQAYGIIAQGGRMTV